MAEEHAALPLMIAVAMTEDANPEIREEDFASTMMAVQDLSLAAVLLWIGPHSKAAANSHDPDSRTSSGMDDGARIKLGHYCL